MFEALTASPPDAIMQLMEICNADSNPDKIDLGAGVYKDDTGHTIIMGAVKKAEAFWNQEETTKGYVGTVGNAEFRRLIVDIILGSDNPLLTAGRVASAQTAGGSGALRLGGELIKGVRPDAVVWVSTPTWANHIPLLGSTGLTLKEYPYYNRDTLGVDFEDMLAHLDTHAKPGDVILLHGCCHNPTGADLSRKQWDELAGFLAERELIPYVDLAYFGLGRGLADDLYGTRKIIAAVPESLIATSCSKNFTLYRERTGLIAIISRDKATTQNVQAQLGTIHRRLISMPPDHGAALVVRILNDPKLRAEWEAELTEMRERIITLRKALSDELKVQGSEAMANAVRAQNGMFSTLPISKEQAERLRSDHSIYVLNSGRMNIAGANVNNIPRFAKALLNVL